jgi:hypothetical protein
MVPSEIGIPAFRLGNTYPFGPVNGYRSFNMARASRDDGTRCVGPLCLRSMRPFIMAAGHIHRAQEVKPIPLSGSHMPWTPEDPWRELQSSTDHGRALVGSDSTTERVPCLRLSDRGVVRHGRRTHTANLRVERWILGHLDDPSLNRMPENAVASLTDPCGRCPPRPCRARAMNNFGHAFMSGDLADRPVPDQGISVFL